MCLLMYVGIFTCKAPRALFWICALHKYSLLLLLLSGGQAGNVIQGMSWLWLSCWTLSGGQAENVRQGMSWLWFSCWTLSGGRERNVLVVVLLPDFVRWSGRECQAGNVLVVVLLLAILWWMKRRRHVISLSIANHHWRRGKQTIKQTVIHV